MKKYRFGDYVLTLKELDERDKNDHILVRHALKKGDETIFAGDDLGCSPMNEPESPESAEALLSFLLLKPGDVEDEWFEKYSERQMEFAESEADLLYEWRHILNPREAE